LKAEICGEQSTTEKDSFKNESSGWIDIV
jgi:hypothetical protein